jgi:hypothetical protein
MRFKLLASATLMAAPFMLFGAYANAVEFSTKLSGFEEVGALNNETGAIFSPGTGTLDLDLNRNARTIAFKLTYSGLSAPVTQAHIHFGKRHVPGGVMVWFCGSMTAPGPTGTQTCPTTSGTVIGMITGANVVGPAAQHVTPGDFDQLVAALVSDSVYANIHTMNFTAGEIRGQVRQRDRDDKR